MDFLFWFLLACLVIMFSLIVAVTAGTIYFFRFTILRKPTATIDNNINANTDWHKHLEFIGERREWFNLQKIEEVYTKSYDGLKLHATLMKSKNPSKKTVICFHGYTSCGKMTMLRFQSFIMKKTSMF